MNVEEILARLIERPSVVGMPNDAIVGWVHRYCLAAAAEAIIVSGPEGDSSNLFVTIGPREARGYVLSGHMDVVPTSEPEWRADPFVLRRDITRAHRPDEYIEIAELAACQEVIEDLGARLAA